MTFDTPEMTGTKSKFLKIPVPAIFRARNRKEFLRNFEPSHCLAKITREFHEEIKLIIKHIIHIQINVLAKFSEHQVHPVEENTTPIDGRVTD
jgi:hypothetical protein